VNEPFRHGLVVGKFYPPHLGHHHLVSVAADRARLVTVLVMAAAAESLPLSERVGWMRAAHADRPTVRIVGVPCDAPVDYSDDTVWTAQVTLMRVAAAQGTDVPVDAVFSSEQYGDELAARLGAVHVPVDPQRRAVPVSGTQVRRDPAGCWHLLAPATRAGLAVRVVAVGAESTGTTTVAEQLAEHYRARGGAWTRTRCVPEYGREYTELKLQQAIGAARTAGGQIPTVNDLVWTDADFDLIAAEQTRLEQEAAAAGSPLLVCDTDAFATAVWERRYLGPGHRPLQPWAAGLLPRHDVYLLTTHDGVPWLDDGIREGELDVRAAMTGWFADALTAAGHSWVLLSGDREQRRHLATRVTNLLLAARLTFPAGDRQDPR
jgi:NadR type nicotinamide-nucleotide adenylyltransferase